MVNVSSVVNDMLIGLQGYVKPDDVQNVKFILWMNLCNYTLTENETALVACKEDTEMIENAWRRDLILSGYTAETVKAYRYGLQAFLRFSRKGVKEIHEEDIRKYLAYGKISRVWADTTYNTQVRILRNFFVWGYENDYLKENPMKKVKDMKTKRSMGYIMTATQREMYRSCCREEREYAIVDLLYSSGARISELCQINWQNINFQKREVKIIGKGKEERYLHFSEQAEVHIRRYLSSRTDDNPALFVGSRKPFKRLTDDGIRYILKEIQQRDPNLKGLKITPHTFRRTCGTDMINRGCAVELVQKKLGHKSVNTTLQCYAALSKESLKEAERKYCVA